MVIWQEKYNNVPENDIQNGTCLEIHDTGDCVYTHTHTHTHTYIWKCSKTCRQIWHESYLLMVSYANIHKQTVAHGLQNINCI